MQAELKANREWVRVSHEFCTTSVDQSDFIGISVFSYQRATEGPALLVKLLND